MARFDKIIPGAGGSRAALGFATVAGDLGTMIGVGLDATGRLARGAGNSGLVGVLCPSEVKAIGQVEDVMFVGEIADVSGLVAGSTYWADGVTGALGAGVAGGAAPVAGAGSGAGSRRIGFTVEAARLVVHFATS